MKEKFKKILSSRFTFMFIPHGAAKPRQINIPVSLLLFLGISWTGITFWGSYLSAQHVDYWRTKLSNEVLKLKVTYLLNQLDKSNSYLDQVKQLESQLRNMLQYRNANALIQEEGKEKDYTGGPTFTDQDDITKLLSHSDIDLSWDRIVHKVDMVKLETQYRMDNFKDISSWVNLKRAQYRAMPMGWPCPGHLTSHFGKRLDPFSGEEEFHCGVDISGDIGTPIKATADGKVRIASWHSGYGNLVVVEHAFGYSTRYAHNSRFLVKPGDIVKRGQAVALMGATGKASGPHSHYEIWLHDHRLNPFTYLKKSSILNTSAMSPAEKASVDPHS